MDPHRADVPEQDDWLVRLEEEAWQRRPFARTFDLLSSEYGWTDDQILDLTMPRLRQVRDVIIERQREQRYRRLVDKENEVRTLAQFSAQTEEAQAAAQSIEFVQPPAGQKKPVRMVSTSMLRKMFSG